MFYLGIVDVSIQCKNRRDWPKWHSWKLFDFWWWPFYFVSPCIWLRW